VRHATQSSDRKSRTSSRQRCTFSIDVVCLCDTKQRIQRGTQKVDAARKRRGVKVVWAAWFYESINKWERQDETPYLLDGPASADDTAASSPVAGADQISSDPEPDADDWDVEPKAPAVVDLSEVSWEDVNAELEEFLAEGDSDSDDEDMESVRATEDETASAGGRCVSHAWSVCSCGSCFPIARSAPSTPRSKRKRLRSITPSEAGTNGGGSGEDFLRSPLAKRKRIGMALNPSPLKVSTLATDDGEAEVGSAADWEEDSRMGDGDETGTEGEDFDFLAGELEEEQEEEENEEEA
jgi:RNA polymerase II subunit A-like phosphatase